MRYLNRTLAVMLSVSLAAGCATTGTVQSVSPSPRLDRNDDRALMSEYVQKLPTGATIKVERIHQGSMRGVLMKATADAIYVQPRTRLPEPAVQIPLNEVLSVTLDSKHGNSIGRAIAIGAAAGAAVVLTMFLVAASMWSD